MIARRWSGKSGKPRVSDEHNDYGTSGCALAVSGGTVIAQTDPLACGDDASAARASTGKSLCFADVRMSGRPPKTATKNLLVGLATCTECGGGLVVETSPRKRGRVPEYVCYRQRHYGCCANARRIRVTEVNEAVVKAIEHHALTPAAVEQDGILCKNEHPSGQRPAVLFQTDPLPITAAPGRPPSRDRGCAASRPPR
jgi:hypothetical protein